MKLKMLKRLTWLSAMLCLVVSLEAAAEVTMDPGGSPARLAVPDQNAPEFLV